MTKYLLNSGGIGHGVDHGQAFFREMVVGLGAHPKILICTFAKPREDWEAKYSNITSGIESVMADNVRPVFEMAFPASFADQVAAADVIYVGGGDDHLLQYWLRQYRLPELWRDKVVATNSASSHALAASFWTCDWRMCMDGLGVLPVKFLAHYESAYGIDDPRGPIDWRRARAELAKYGDPSLPIYALHEGEFKVFEV